MNPKITSLLVVDDDPVFTRFVCQLVQALADELPCQVTCADSAEAAEEAIRHGQFDLALVDFHLPRASGLDLLAKISSLPPGHQPAVVMLTGSGNESVAVEAMKRGAKDYLQKNEVDVASLMRKQRQDMKRFEVTAEATVRAGVYPAVFTAVDLAFRIEGAVDPALAVEAARLSQTRFCAISAMLSRAVPIRYQVLVNGTAVGSGEAQFAPDS